MRSDPWGRTCGRGGIVIDIRDGTVATSSDSGCRRSSPPVGRVAFSAFVFTRQRDWLYVVVTPLVLTVLLCRLFVGTDHSRRQEWIQA